MELGESNIRRHGVNTLQNAVHPQYGLAWTDGSSVFLAPVTANAGQLQDGHSKKLGEFNHVQGLHWSCSLRQCAYDPIAIGTATNGITHSAEALGNGILNGTSIYGSNDVADGASCVHADQTDHFYCYLCVTHDATVSLWKVDGQAADIGLRQVRKINATPIAQGCLWNPVEDILCILHHDMCSLYFRHLENKGSYALPPIESGRIRCGCWLDDGSKLVIAIGSIVLIYQWKDIARCVSDFTIVAWKIPGLDAQVTTMVPANNNRVVCLAEMPLDQLCVNTDLFEMPVLQTGHSEAVIKPTTDVTQSLMQLKTNSQLLTNDKSQLIVFEMRDGEMGARKLFSRQLSATLSPDLLHYDVTSQSVVVACNSRNSLQVFRLSHDQLTKTHEIILGKDDRPKGLCGISAAGFHDNQILMMVGSLRESGSEFLSTSVTAEYKLRLCCILVNRRKTEANDYNAANGDIDLHITEPTRSVSPPPPHGRTSSLHVRWQEPECQPVKMPRRKRKKMHSTGLDITKLTGGVKLPPNIDALQLFDHSKLDILRLPGARGSHLLESGLRGRFDEGKAAKRLLIAELPAVVHDMIEMANADDVASVPDLETAISQQSAKIARLQERIDEIQRLLTEVGGPAVVANVLGSAVKSAKVEPPPPPTTTTVDVNSNTIPLVNHMDTTQDVTQSGDTTTESATTFAEGTTNVSEAQMTDSGTCMSQMVDGGHGANTATNATQDIIEESMDKMTIVQNADNTLIDHSADVVDDSEKVMSDSGVLDICQDGINENLTAHTTPTTIVDTPNSNTTSPAPVVRRDSTVGTTSDDSPVDMTDRHMPQLLHLVLQDENKMATAMTKTFLLDNGRLRLDLVKEAFGLATVELMFDGLSCVVGCSPDGYIPMKFVPNRTMYLTGNKA